MRVIENETVFVVVKISVARAFLRPPAFKYVILAYFCVECALPKCLGALSSSSEYASLDEAAASLLVGLFFGHLKLLKGLLDRPLDLRDAPLLPPPAAPLVLELVLPRRPDTVSVSGLD